jgi:hypothetical protein
MKRQTSMFGAGLIAAVVHKIGYMNEPLEINILLT